jgi:hypothetical protein
LAIAVRGVLLDVTKERGIIVIIDGVTDFLRLASCL